MVNRKNAFYSPFTIHHSRVHFAGTDVVPGFDGGQRTVIRHVAFERRDGDVTMLDGVIVSAFGGVPGKVFFADPVIRLAARVNVFADDGARIFESLPRDANAFDLAFRDVDVEQRPLRQSFLQDLTHGCGGE